VTRLRVGRQPLSEFAYRQVNKTFIFSTLSRPCSEVLPEVAMEITVFWDITQ
jgi:hypothetical protein